LDKTIFARLPNEPGVYYFHDDQGKVIYIGKSKDIRTRVISHFSNRQSAKTQEMCENIADISFVQTGSELLALLMESDEIKKNLPLYNRLQRRTLYKYGLVSFENQAGYTNLQLVKLTPSKNPYTVFSSYEEATTVMFSVVYKYDLCQKLSGLYHSQGACFHHSIGQCKGACIGEESPDSYNERVSSALASFSHPWKNMLLIDKGRHEEESSAVLIENGKYVGFGWFDHTENSNDRERIKECIKTYPDNRDIQQIIRLYTRTHKGLKYLKF
jgi:DNA polymerase III subunit epsilon